MVSSSPFNSLATGISSWFVVRIWSIIQKNRVVVVYKDFTTSFTNGLFSCLLTPNLPFFSINSQTEECRIAVFEVHSGVFLFPREAKEIIALIFGENQIALLLVCPCFLWRPKFVKFFGYCGVLIL